MSTIDHFCGKLELANISEYFDDLDDMYFLMLQYRVMMTISIASICKNFWKKKKNIQVHNGETKLPRQIN